jgi:hypothetical protein
VWAGRISSVPTREDIMSVCAGADHVLVASLLGFSICRVVICVAAEAEADAD